MRSSIHPPTIRSNDFDKTAVNEMGLKSLLITRGGLAFRIGITLADFQIVGTKPSLMNVLNIVHTRWAKMRAWSRSIQLGMSSGPVALFTLILANSFITVSVSMV